MDLIYLLTVLLIICASDLIAWNRTTTDLQLDDDQSHGEESKKTSTKTSTTTDTVLSESNGTSSSLNFGGGTCGEPLIAQQVLIDFTPDQELDTDYSQEKCCLFWKFFNNTPELQNVMVYPDPELTRQMSEPAERSEPASSTSTPQPKTAVSMLSFVQQKGLINKVFATKAPKSQCSVRSREYQHSQRETMKRKKTKCSCGSCPPCQAASGLVRDLCEDMDKWNKEHPKNMDPPTHNPELRHCILQRKVDNSYLK